MIVRCACLAFLIPAIALGTLAMAPGPAPAQEGPATEADSPQTPAASAQPSGESASPATGDSSPPAYRPPETIDLKPYRVLIAVAVHSDPTLDAAFRSWLLDELSSRIHTRIGDLWQADLGEMNWLQPATAASLRERSAEALNERLLATDYHKAFLVTLQRQGPEFTLAVREWDRNSHTATSATTATTCDSRLLPDRLYAEILTHFRPIAEIEQVFEDGKTVELRIRGGELIPPDGHASPVFEGAYFRPYYRYLDRKRELRQLQHLPWTYLKVQEINRGLMICTLDSAFPSPLAGTRRRVELMAIAVKPKFDRTALTIHPRAQPDNPLVGLRVDVMDRHPTDDDPVEDREVHLTDRNGVIHVEADRQQPLRYVYVHSGKSVLAVVPFIPGDVPSTMLDVPDDSPRLAVEGEMSLMEAELIETVARREVLISRAFGLSKAGRWQEIDEVVKQVQALPRAADFKARIDQIELVSKARAEGDRVQQIRITRLCQQVRETAEKYLPEERVTTFLKEIRDLQSTQGRN